MERGIALDLHDYDVVILNTSGGKDSQSMIDFMVEQADAQDYDRDRLVAVHADLGRVEWEGVPELAEKQATHYGLRFEKISRPQGDLLDQIEERHEKLRARGDETTPAWPSSNARYCTSDQKRGQIRKVITALVKELDLDRQARVLNCMGIRAQESSARSKKEPFSHDKSATSGNRWIDTFYPIFDWTEEEVWERIRESGVDYHEAYDIGMPRLSCVFCVFAPKSALLLAAQHNPKLGREYADLENRMGHTFRQDLSIAEVVEEAEQTDAEALKADLDFECNWTM